MARNRPPVSYIIPASIFLIETGPVGHPLELRAWKIGRSYWISSKLANSSFREQETFFNVPGIKSLLQYWKLCFVFWIDNSRPQQEMAMSPSSTDCSWRSEWYRICDIRVATYCMRHSWLTKFGAIWLNQLVLSHNDVTDGMHSSVRSLVWSSLFAVKRKGSISSSGTACKTDLLKTTIRVILIRSLQSHSNTE